MKRIPLSVFIIAKNEADRIPFAINSVRNFADEVIVIDSGSTDNTTEVASRLGADKVIFNEWKGYGPQKIFGESLCRNNWLLNIDADEEISPELAEEIIKLFENGEPEIAQYGFRLKTIFMHQKNPVPFGNSFYIYRLYNKQYAGFKDSTVHDSVITKNGLDKKIKFNSFAIHRCFRSLSHMIEKINFYSSMQAEDMVKRGRKPPAIRIIFEPFFAFLKVYFIKRYFIYGVDGFIHSVIYAASRTLRLAKVRELYQIKNSNS